jgi:hypothetical protein
MHGGISAHIIGTDKSEEFRQKTTRISMKAPKSFKNGGGYE